MGPWFLFPFLGYLFVSCKFEKFQSDRTLNGNNWLAGWLDGFFFFFLGIIQLVSANAFMGSH